MVRDDLVNEIQDRLRPSTLRVRLLVPNESLIELALPEIPRNGEVVFVKGKRYVVVAHNWHVDEGIFGGHTVAVDVILSERENGY